MSLPKEVHNFILLIVDRFADLFAKKGKEEVTA